MIFFVQMSLLGWCPVYSLDDGDGNQWLLITHLFWDQTIRDDYQRPPPRFSRFVEDVVLGSGVILPWREYLTL